MVMTSIIAAIALAFQPAQPEDRAAADLTIARTTYETVMQSARADIDKALKKKLDAASKPGAVSNDALDAARAEKAAFESRGTWPEGPDADRARARAATAAGALLDAFGRALAAYTKLENEPLAQAIVRERDEFESQSDIVPWGLNLVKTRTDAERTLSPGGLDLTLTGERPAGYRLEVLAKRTGESGDLIAEIPIDQSKRITVSSQADKQGRIRLMLSVRPDWVSADLGAMRPIDLSKAVPGEHLVFRAAGGPIVLESVRFKPILDGTPEPMADKSKPQQPGKALKEDPNDRYTAGRSWRGQDKNGGMAVIRLVRRDGDRVEFEAPGTFAGAVWRVSGKLRSGVVAVDDMDRIRNPAGHPAVRVASPGGSIRITADGKLNFYASGRLSGGDRQNIVAEFNFKNAEPD